METQAPAVNPLNNAATRPHPMIITAAAAVTLFSATGIAALAGWLPHSTGTTAAPEALVAPAAPVVSTSQAKPRTRIVTQRTEPESRPVVLSQAPAVSNPPAAEPVRKICFECGTIDSVRQVERPGETNGVGIGIGAVAGGLLGRQMGGGRGRDAMTVLGAIGGAVAGNQIEKHQRKTTEYQVTVRFEDGSTQTLTQPTEPGWRPGDRVRVVNGSIQANG